MAHRHKVCSRRSALVLIAGLTCAGALAQVAPPDIRQDEGPRRDLDAEPSLQGVPERVQARIVDTTRVSAEKRAYAPGAVPGLRPYVSLLMKERPWHFTALRPRQRRALDARQPVFSPNALAEVLAESAGRLSYDVTVTDSSEAVHGALFVDGDHQNDDYTQGRESLRDLRVGGVLDLESARQHVVGELWWRSRSSDWLRDAAERRATLEGTVVSGGLGGDHIPRESGGVRFQWSADGTAYEMPVAGRADMDRVTEGTVGASLELGWDIAPLRVNVQGAARRTEAAFPILTDGTQDTGIGMLSIEDRSLKALNGVLDARVGIAGYVDPIAGGVDREVVWRAPFRAGWTTVVGGVGHLRVHGGYSVDPFPVQQYVTTDFAVVNEGLAALTAWSAGASVWRRQWGAVVGGTVEWVDAENLPVWAELPSDSGLVAWRPTPVTARLVKWTAFVQGLAVGPVVFEARALGEASEPGTDQGVEHLPYRPSLIATLEGNASLGWGLGLSASGEWTGNRYVDLVGNEQLEGYARLRVRVSKRITGHTSLFAVVETSFDEYRKRESALTREAYDLEQETVGLGISGSL